ncbi:MAG: PKD domain-containing protein, partial [Roseiflexaceae bacterium]|nr:PKD domain-containing protein [Roseiflexaceae bacterium]
EPTAFAATTPTLTRASYSWNFGDGTTSSGRTASHTYAAAGTYTATVTATNEAGTYTASTQVNVIVPKTAQTSFQSSIGGGVPTVAASGNYAYIGEGAAFVVVDVSNPAAPRRVARLQTAEMVQAIRIVGQRAYITVDRAGLLIVDIASPTAPVIVGRISEPESLGSPVGASFYDVQVAGSVAYVASSSAFLVFDVSNPAAPRLLSRVNGESYDLAVQGDRVYVAQGFNGVGVFDVSDPANPVTIPGYYNGPALGVQVIDGTIYQTSQSRLLVFDGASSWASEDLGRVKDVVVAGDRAYVTHYTGKVTIFGLSAISSPVLLGSIETPGESWDVQAVGNWLYIADGENGLLITDATTPSTVTTIGRYAAWGANDVAVAGRYAYVAATSGLRAIDLENSAQPREVGAAATGAPAVNLKLAGQRAYVVTERLDSEAGVSSSRLELFDISNPSTPVALGSIDLYRRSPLAIVGNHVYVAGEGGLSAIDVSDPNAPVAIALPAAVRLDWIYDIASDGTKLYVLYNKVNEGRRLAILDASALVPVLQSDISGNGRLIALSGNYAYLSGYGPTNAVDVGETTNPRPIIPLASSTDINFLASLVADSPLIYVIESGLNDGYLQILDATNPGRIRRLEVKVLTAPGKGIALRGSTLLLADGEGGLLLNSVQVTGVEQLPPSPTPVTPMPPMPTSQRVYLPLSLRGN